FPLGDGRFVLGRSAECDFVIQDPTVSRQHAEIVVDNGSVSIRDLGSRNGTYVDDEKAAAIQAVRCGQRLRLGNVSFVLTTPAKPDSQSMSDLETDLPPEEQECARQPTQLSPAQRRVFDQLLIGLADKQIAKKLGISPKTVHLHVQAIFR